MILDSGAVEPQDAILLGARSLDPPELEYIAAIGLRTDAEELDRALAGTEGVYVALDVDALEPGEIEPVHARAGRPHARRGRAAASPGSVERSTILGAGFSALAAEPANVEPLTRLALALGL